MLVREGMDEFSLCFWPVNLATVYNGSNHEFRFILDKSCSEKYICDGFWIFSFIDWKEYSSETFSI